MDCFDPRSIKAKLPRSLRARLRGIMQSGCGEQLQFNCLIALSSRPFGRSRYRTEPSLISIQRRLFISQEPARILSRAATQGRLSRKQPRNLVYRQIAARALGPNSVRLIVLRRIFAPAANYQLSFQFIACGLRKFILACREIFGRHHAVAGNWRL